MKKIFIAMFAIASISAMAQEGPQRGRQNNMEDLTPEQVATLQTKKMTLALDLSKAQQEAVHKIQLENATLMRAKREEGRKLQEGEKPAKRTQEERFARQNERLDHQIAQKEKMKKILSPEQYEKWEKTMHHQRKHKGARKEGKPNRRG